MIKRETTTATTTRKQTIPQQRNNYIIPRQTYLKDSDRFYSVTNRPTQNQVSEHRSKDTEDQNNTMNQLM